MIKNITLSDEEAVIEQARRRASEEGKTLNELFRAWLASYVSRPESVNEYRDLMKRLTHVKPGRKFSRDEANER